jgi:hypothetical protein
MGKQTMFPPNLAILAKEEAEIVNEQEFNKTYMSTHTPQ